EVAQAADLVPPSDDEITRGTFVPDELHKAQPEVVAEIRDRARHALELARRDGDVEVARNLVRVAARVAQDAEIDAALDEPVEQRLRDVGPVVHLLSAAAAHSPPARPPRHSSTGAARARNRARAGPCRPRPRGARAARAARSPRLRPSAAPTAR